MKNPREICQVESTTLSQRLIHGDVRTETVKEAVWRILASACCGEFIPVQSRIARLLRRTFQLLRDSKVRSPQSIVHLSNALEVVHLKD